MDFPYVYDDEDNVCLIEGRCGHNTTGVECNTSA